MTSGNAKRTMRGLRPARAIQRLMVEFIQLEAASGSVLLACTVIAMAWANSPWGGAYRELWGMHAAVHVGDQVLDLTLGEWVNDALMAAYFLLVGLEIKRELLVGELASVRKAALPIIAAAGGMAVPAAIYIALNWGTEAIRGWGIPVATDIAFSLGILAIVGGKAPSSCRVFLAAFAIADDVGAAVVIALFYASGLSPHALGIAAAVIACLIAANRAGVRSPAVYATLGAALWLAFLHGGIHPTIAGIVTAFAIPARTRIDADEFLASSRDSIAAFEQAGAPETTVLANSDQRDALQALENACIHAQTPLQRLEHGLHPWVSFGIVPIFALANAGVSLEGTPVLDVLTRPVTLGVALGLIFGKQIGISVASWLAVRAGAASLPDGMRWRDVYGMGCLGGIGFTMSLFIAGLAFGNHPALLGEAKIGILSASLVTSVWGWLAVEVGARRGSGASRER